MNSFPRLSTEMSEQDMVSLLFQALSRFDQAQSPSPSSTVSGFSPMKAYSPCPEIESMFRIALKTYPKSYLIHHYHGIYFSFIHHIQECQSAYKTSIFLQPKFIGSSLNLAKHYSIHEQHEDTIRVLSPWFAKKKQGVSDDIMLEIGVTMSTSYKKMGDRKGEKRVYEILKDILHTLPSWNEKQLLVWKVLCLSEGTYHALTDHLCSVQSFQSGLQPPSSHVSLSPSHYSPSLIQIHRQLYQSLIVSMDYLFCPSPRLHDWYHQCDTIYQPFPSEQTIQASFPRSYSVHSKIRLGYFTSSFNKNAVGLFCTPLLKYYNSTTFDVYVFYNNEGHDEFSSMFRSWVPSQKWFNVHLLSDIDLARLMCMNEIDILIDLEGHAHGGRMGLFYHLPPHIRTVTYLGFPNTTGSSRLQYRLTDSICDPVISSQYYSETLVRLPRAFVCYHLFETVPLPPVSYTNTNHDSPTIHIGVFNRFDKQNLVMRELWKRIIKQNPQVIFYIKLENEKVQRKFYEDVPKTQLRFIPFQSTLDSDFMQMYPIDFCVDTYPYSGTTTTCSQLLMGLPTFTIYKPDLNRHVSNVSTSLMVHSLSEEDAKKYICSSEKEYEKKIQAEIQFLLKEKARVSSSDYQIREQHIREKRRTQFMNYMDPIEFMKCFETCLSSLFLSPLSSSSSSSSITENKG